MPLHVTPIPGRSSKGDLLAWLLKDDLMPKSKVGEIALRGSHALIEIPPALGPEVAKKQHGSLLLNRMVNVWYEADSPAEDQQVGAHFRRLRAWLDDEAKAQTEQMQQVRQSAPESDTALSLRKLQVRSSDLGLGGLHILSLGRKNPMASLPPVRLKVGTPIELSPESPAPSFSPRRGVVTRLDQQTIDIAIAKGLAEGDEEEEVTLFRLDAVEDEVSLRRARTALHMAEHTPSPLRQVLLGLSPSAAEAAPEPLTPISTSLNASQIAAVEHALHTPDVAIIHGPPGTGKTTTLLELIRQAIRRGESVLACAPSNLAVDNLVEGLLQANESVLRLGHPIRMLPAVRQASLDEQVRKHRDMKVVKKYRADAQVLFRKASKQTRAGMDRSERRALRDDAKALLDDARRVEQGIIGELLRQASVICATNTGLDVRLLGAQTFDLVVIDEACQCTEADAWIPINRARRLVLAGDPCQLPPTIISDAAAKAGFAVSLPERLIEQSPDCSRLLTVQYRMHEEIMAFSSEEFYHGQLTADPQVATHTLIGLPDVAAEEQTETALHFIDTSGALYDEVRNEESGSTANPEEAKLAAKKAADLIAFGVAPTAIAIITPYNAQVRAIRDALADRSIEVEVGTIDGFQGREAEAVIISLARSNPDGKVGFLADTRRMNVALTRARRKLYLIGDSATISAHPFYARLLDHFGALDAYFGVWDEVE